MKFKNSYSNTTTDVRGMQHMYSDMEYTIYHTHESPGDAIKKGDVKSVLNQQKRFQECSQSLRGLAAKYKKNNPELAGYLKQCANCEQDNANQLMSKAAMLSMGK